MVTKYRVLRWSKSKQKRLITASHCWFKRIIGDLMDHPGDYLYRTRVLIFDSFKALLNLLWQATQLFHALLSRS